MKANETKVAEFLSSIELGIRRIDNIQTFWPD